MKTFTLYCSNNLFLFVFWKSRKPDGIPSGLPEGSIDRDSELKVSIKEFEVKITDINSHYLWNNDSLRQFWVSFSNIGVDFSLNLLDEIVSRNVQGGGESRYCTSWGFRNFSENRTIVSIENSLSIKVIEFNRDGSLICRSCINSDSNSKGAWDWLSILG